MIDNVDLNFYARGLVARRAMLYLCLIHEAPNQEFILCSIKGDSTTTGVYGGGLHK